MSVKKIGEFKYAIEVHLRNVSRVKKIFRGTRPQAEEKELKMKNHLKILRNKVNDAITDLAGVLWHYFYHHLMRKPSHKRSKNIYNSKNKIEHILSFLGNPSVLDEEKFADHFDKKMRILENQEKYAILENMIITVHAAFEKAIKKRKLPYDKNPVPYDMTYLPDKERRWDIISIEKFHELLDVLPPFLHPIAWMAYRVPMRMDELRCLTREKIRFEDGTAYLEWTKNSHPRTIPIPKRLFSYFSNLPEGACFLFFRYAEGKFHKLGNINKIWRAAVKKIGLPGLHFHDLRATAARNMALLGMRKEIIARIGGWVNMHTFNEFYRRIQTKEVTNQYHRFEKIKEFIEDKFGSIENIHLGEGNTPLSEITLNSSTGEMYGPEFLQTTKLNTINKNVFGDTEG